MNIAQKQKDLALKADSKQTRIGNLYPYLCSMEWITQAMKNVLSNKGARTSGIDGIAKERYYDPKYELTSYAKNKIKELVEGLESNSYQPVAVKRIYIPKANGDKRPIGIPTLDDRVIQEAIRMVLEPIYESDFLDCSNGFRPKRNTMEAIRICYQRINPKQKYYWIIEGDIKGCFDNIDHKILLKLLRKRIADNRLVSLIRKILKAGIEEDGKIYKLNKGTPQGGVISPLLANIYLHEMDKWWEREYHPPENIVKFLTNRRRKGKGNYILSRYADDFIILSNDRKESVEEMRVYNCLFLFVFCW